MNSTSNLIWKTGSWSLRSKNKTALSNLPGQGNEWHLFHIIVCSLHSFDSVLLFSLPGDTCLSSDCENFRITGNSCKKQTAVVHFQYEVHLEVTGVTEKQEALDLPLPSWHPAPACLRTRFGKSQASSASCLSPHQKRGAVSSPKLFIGRVFV